MKKVSRNVGALGWVSFLNDASSEMIFPILPMFLADVLGLPKTLIGLIDGLAEGTASVLKVFSGYISDRIGRMKALALGGYAGSTLVKPLLFFATGFPMVLLVRLLDRIGKGIRTSPRDALIAASSSDKYRGRSFGFHRMMDTGGAVLGTLLAFLLLKYFVGGDLGRIRYIFLLSVIPGVLAITVLAIFVRDPKRPVKSGIAISFGSVLRKLDANAIRFLTASAVFALSNFTYSFFILRASEMGVKPALIPAVYLIYNVVYMLSSYPGGVLADRFGTRRVLLFGYGVYALTALGFALLGASWFSVLLFVGYGLFQGIVNPNARTMISLISAEEHRGTFLGIYHTVVGVSAFPASLIAGALWDSFGSQATFIAGAALSVIAFALLFTVKTGRNDAH